jgi:hypothetical protein
MVKLWTSYAAGYDKNQETAVRKAGSQRHSFLIRQLFFKKKKTRRFQAVWRMVKVNGRLNRVQVLSNSYPNDTTTPLRRWLRQNRHR